MALPGISQHLARQLGGPFAGLQEILDNLPPGRFRRCLLQQQTGISDYPHQQIVEVMRNAPGQHAQTLQLLRLPQLVFKLLALGHIHGHSGHAHRGAAGIVARPAAHK